MQNLKTVVNTLTTDDKYSLLNKDNSTQPIQMQLPQKQNIFSEFFSRFLKSIWNFEHLNKNDSQEWYISDITDSGKRG